MDIPKAAAYGVSAALFAAMIQKSDDAAFWAKSPLLGCLMGATMVFSLGSGGLAELWRRDSVDREPSNFITVLIMMPPLAGFVALTAFFATFSPQIAWAMLVSLLAAISMQYAVPDPKKSQNKEPAADEQDPHSASPTRSAHTPPASPIASSTPAE